MLFLSAVVATTADNFSMGGDRIKEDTQFKVKLLEELNTNLSLLLEKPEERQFEQLKERLTLIDQCIDQALLLIMLESKTVNQLHH